MILDLNHEYYMKLALDVAVTAMTQGELPIGAVVVCGDQIIARSSTKKKLWAVG